MSETYLIELEDQGYILQMADNTEAHELENCLRSFIFLKDSQVPVPEVFTQEVRKLNSRSYTIVEKLLGKTRESEVSSEESELAGACLAHIHEAKKFDEPGWIEWEDGEPVVVGFPGNSLRSRVEEVMEKRLGFFQKQEIDWLAEVTERFLDIHIEKVPGDFEPVFVHHDHNPGNILFHKGEITGVLDFDYAHSSHAQRDLAKAANKFWFRGGDREALYKGYSSVREIGGYFDQNRPVYLLESLIDELGVMIDLDHMKTEEAKHYRKEIERIENQIG